MDKVFLCMNCMHIIDDGCNVCPHCGNSVNVSRDIRYLPAGAEIADRYIVGKTLYEYGDGVTYLGYDTVEKAVVDIREFFIPSIVKRDQKTNSIRVRKDDVTLYTESYKQFILLWRSLMKVKNPCIPRVYDVIPNINVTGYVIMQHRDDVPLTDYIKANTTAEAGFSWEETEAMFGPLIAAVDKLNYFGIICRCISPDSVFIDSNGCLMLKGFCIGSMCNSKSTLPSYVFDGYAPIEQYGFDYRQGSQTDVYSLACCMYTVLTGMVPPDSQSRLTDDQLMIQQSVVDSLSPDVISGLFDSLSVLPNERIRNASGLLRELGIHITKPGSESESLKEKIRKMYNKALYSPSSLNGVENSIDEIDDAPEQYITDDTPEKSEAAAAEQAADNSVTEPAADDSVENKPESNPDAVDRSETANDTDNASAQEEESDTADAAATEETDDSIDTDTEADTDADIEESGSLDESDESEADNTDNSSDIEQENPADSDNSDDNNESSDADNGTETECDDKTSDEPDGDISEDDSDIIPRKDKEKSGASAKGRKTGKKVLVKYGILSFFISLAVCFIAFAALYPTVLYKVDVLQSPSLDRIYAAVYNALNSEDSDEVTRIPITTTNSDTTSETDSSEADSSTSETAVGTTGTEKIEVPNFVKMSYAVVSTNDVYKKRFNLKYEFKSSDEYGKNVIMSQSVKAGTEVNIGSVITLTVSSGSKTVLLPDVAGMDYDKAYTDLTTLGFKVVKVTAENDGTHTPNEVIEMSNVAGLTYDYGISITLKVWDETNVSTETTSGDSSTTAVVDTPAED